MDNLRKVGRHMKLSKQPRDSVIHVQDNKEWDFKYMSDLKQFQHVSSTEKEVKIDDLSSQDRARVRRIAEKEYHRIAKKYGIVETLKDRMKHKTDKLGTNIAQLFGSHSVFGVKLKTLMEQDQSVVQYGRIPLVAKMLFDCLNKKCHEETGVISMPTNEPAAVAEVKKMMAKNFYENRTAIEEKLMAGSPKIAGDVLKFFIKHLPNTLFTSDYSDAFYQLPKIREKSDQLKAAKMLIFQLSDVNANVLIDLMLLLQKIAGGRQRKESVVNSLAFVMTPALFDMPELERKDPGAPYIVTQLLINCADMLAVVPPFVVGNLKEKKEKDERESTEKDSAALQPATGEGQLRVTAPEFNLVNFALEIAPPSTAGDVLVMFFNRIKSKVAPPLELKKEGIRLCLMKLNDVDVFVKNHKLFEAGGNVSGERMLNKETVITRALRENPKGKWYIRCVHKQ